MEEIEYIEPTQEHVGQMVEVSDDCMAWYDRKLLGVVDAVEKFVTSYNGCTIGWKYARISRPLTYAERQAKCGLKVGDRVRILRSHDANELGYGVAWSCRNMDGTIGKVMTISDVSKNLGFYLKGFWYPYFVLEKITDRVATHIDLGATVYVDGAPQDEFSLILVWQELDGMWRAVVRSGDKRFVYELSNLRVKE